MKPFRITNLILFILVFLTFMSACNPKPTQTEVPAITPTATDEPTNTPVLETVPVQERVIFLAQQVSDPSQFDAIQGLLTVLAEEEGLLLVTTDSLAIEPWDASIRIVVAMETGTDLISLANSRPEVQFLALDIPNLVASANLSIINISLEVLQDQAFLAGYLAAITTEDYRVGVLVSSDDEIGQAVAQSFFIGSQYFCGLCNSRFGPIEYYPKMALISDPLQQQSWQSAVDLLIARSVQTVFIQSEVISTDLITYLTANEIRIIAPNNQWDSQQSQNWLATLQPDPLSGIELLWPQLLNGQGGLEAAYTFHLINLNPELLSEGRSAFFMKTFDDVLSGFIDTAGTD